jgi:very-short-patch-repair endonuclease
MWLWTLLPAPPDTGPHFLVPYRAGNKPSGLWTVHRTRDFDSIEPANKETILATNPLRTLVDFAARAAPAELTAAVDQAIATRLVTPEGLEAEIERLSGHGRAGVADLRRHLRQRGFSGAPAPSVLEAKLHRIIVGAGLPVPETETEVRVEGGRYRLDVAWSAIRFAVEADGYAWHFSPEQTVRDNARRQKLRDAGWCLLVYTWTEIVNEPARVAREISEKFHQLSRPAGTAAAG